MGRNPTMIYELMLLNTFSGYSLLSSIIIADHMTFEFSVDLEKKNINEDILPFCKDIILTIIQILCFIT